MMSDFETLSSCYAVSDSFTTPWTVALQTSLSRGFPGRNTAWSCHFLLQDIFLAQESNPHLQH